MSSTTTSFAPLAASTGEPVKLAMQRLWLTGQVLPAGARLTVQHVFKTEEDKPLEVIYCFPLPRDSALRRFRISTARLRRICPIEKPSTWPCVIARTNDSTAGVGQRPTMFSSACTGVRPICCSWITT